MVPKESVDSIHVKVARLLNSLSSVFKKNSALTTVKYCNIHYCKLVQRDRM